MIRSVISCLRPALEGSTIEESSKIDTEYDVSHLGHESKQQSGQDVKEFGFVDILQLTAYHESGHAVVAFNTAGANPIHKATIMPRGTALGMVTQLPEKDETSISKMQLLARLDVCMGGRVAEEMIFGADQVTSGARSDLQQATALARHMVGQSSF